MSRTWKTLSPRQQDVARSAVGALMALDALTASEDGADWAEPPHRVTFRDLLVWLQGAEPRLSRDVERAVAADQRLARDLERLLYRTAGWHGARAAAASSGALDVREGDGFRLRIKPSRAGPGLIYLLIDLAGDRQPTILVLRGPSCQYVKMALPVAQDGVIQVLTEETTEEVRLLRDPATELFLW